MKWLINLIDRDVVDWMNRGPGTIYAGPRLFLKIIPAIMVMAAPFLVLGEPLKTYWLFAYIALVLTSLSVLVWRIVAARQRLLEKREVDELGSYVVPPNDRYEVPSE